MQISPAFFMLAMLAVAALSGCAKDADRVAGTPKPEAFAITADNSITAMTILSATLAECPSGGSLIELFKDANNNGVFDPTETLVSTTKLCNGRDGATGSTGATGNTGAAGASAFITATPASPTQCPAGGIVYVTHTDGSGPQTSVICNGSNGSSGNNAKFAMGAVGSIVAGQTYSACHHDYLYIPDLSSKDRGWLIFRHQKNGSADQGIGSTGFNVWNVDISDFYLVSEQNNEVYCQLHWEPAKQILSYTVVSKLDGLAGEKGEIKMK